MDAGTQSFRWQGTMAVGEIRLFGYSLVGPSVCDQPGTVYTNTLTIDDGYHPPFMRKRPSRRRDWPNARGVVHGHADIDAGRALSLSAADRAPIDQCVAE